jgi:hypothetical protein
MSEVRAVISRARSRHRAPRRLSDVNARLAALEAELQEHRQLNRRVAELTDLVADLLVPLAKHDLGAVDEIIDRYRASI